jgi:hypothetical protein
MRTPPSTSRRPPPARKPIATHRNAGTRAPTRRVIATSREPSAFMTTADQLPFSSGHVIV